MSNRKDGREIQKQHSVTSRCLAIVLSESDVRVPATSDNAAEVNGKEILEDFKLRNKTCYWNPALIESIEKLEYKGFLQPSTILVQGSDLHLENLRTAWGRRVLNNPVDYKIERIGDVNGIEMEVIPQTQFIPLPEILCLIVMDLNNKQVIATLDVIQEQLKQCYQGMSIPSPQLTYDTLGSLIRERKVFHTGSGYFVVTPDTYRLPEDPTKTVPLPWLHYNPMYIPVLNQQSHLMRSISCQVTLVDEQQKAKDAGGKTEMVPREQARQVAQQTVPDKPRLARSLSVRRVKDKAAVKDIDSVDLKRSLSVRGRNEKDKNADINLAKSSINKNKGEKKSFISKIFGRKKKSATVTKEPAKEVECATFSAQFPPPEWTWYREQVDKQSRIQKWVQQVPRKPIPGQISNESAYGVRASKYATYSYNGIHPNHGVQPHQLKVHTIPAQRIGDYEEIDDIDLDPNIRDTPLTQYNGRGDHYAQRRMSEGRIRRREHKSHRRSLDKKTSEQIYQNTVVNPATHGSKFETPSFPYHTDFSTASQQQTSHPMYSSTPRTGPSYMSMETQYRLNPHCEQVETIAEEPKYQHREHSHHHKSSRSKRKSHRHHGYHGNHPMADISTEYFGRMPKKDSSFAMSCDSGVNCVGLGLKHSNSQKQNVKQSSDSQKDRSKQNNVKLQNNTENTENISEKETKNKVVCEVEINKCIQRTENEYVTMDAVVKEEDSKSNSESLNLESIAGSDVSYDTVVKKEMSKTDIEHVTKETGELILGDSGFCSPRVVDGESPSNENREIQSRVEDLKKASNSNLCPKNVYHRSDEGSLNSDEEIQSNDKENKYKVLNNMKSVHQERSVLTHYNQVQHLSKNSEAEPTFMHQIPFKFNFDDDYEVVGVV